MFYTVKKFFSNIWFVITSIAVGGLGLLLFLQKRKTKQVQEELDDANDTIQQSQMVAFKQKVESDTVAREVEETLEKEMASANDHIRNEVIETINDLDQAVKTSKETGKEVKGRLEL